MKTIEKVSNNPMHDRQQNSPAGSWEKAFPVSARRAGLGFAIGLTLLLLSGTTAYTSMCIIPSEEGSWDNYNAQTRGIPHLDFRMECRDASTTTCSGSICSTTFAVEPHYFIHLFGSCSPTDCDWGEVEGTRLTGSLDGWYYFFYDQGFAKRYVYARTYPAWPGWLRLYIWTDFSSPYRQDYSSDEWFLGP